MGEVDCPGVGGGGGGWVRPSDDVDCCGTCGAAAVLGAGLSSSRASSPGMLTLSFFLSSWMRSR